jgi:hypothetical protein
MPDVSEEHIEFNFRFRYFKKKLLDPYRRRQ